MKRAFSLAELLITVAILGILAAIIFPTFQSHTQQAKEAAAKDNLRILRNTIDLYAAQHNGIAPGYPNDDPSRDPVFFALLVKLVYEGKYLPRLPENPFNEIRIIEMVSNSEPFPAEATGSFGWIYKPATREIRLDWPGTDSTGMRYFDY